MTQKEINELQERVYAISYSKFPLDLFFNDIKMNKDSNYSKDMAYEDLKLITDEIYRLRELEKTPTLEEVIKEWGKLGYELNRHERRELIFEFKEDGTIFTMWNFNSIRYSKYWRGKPANISLQEHNLLTKTMKALGWKDE